MRGSMIPGSCSCLRISRRQAQSVGYAQAAARPRSVRRWSSGPGVHAETEVLHCCTWSCIFVANRRTRPQFVRLLALDLIRRYKTKARERSCGRYIADGGWLQTAHLVAVSKAALTRVNVKRLFQIENRPLCHHLVKVQSLTDSLTPQPVQSLDTLY